MNCRDSQINGRWVEPDPFIEFGLRYHRECEAFDQAVCSNRDRYGFAIPADGRERRLINRNARNVKDRLLKELGQCSKSRLQKAIRDSSRLFEIEFKKQANV